MATRHTPQHVLILGCGSVSQCLLPMLLDHFGFDPSSVTIFESRDNRDRVSASLARGVHYEQGTITAETMDETLSTHLGDGDLLIDLAWNIDMVDILQWSRDHGVRYLNTSSEVWDPFVDASRVSPTERTLYHRHMALRRLVASWPDNDGSPAVIEHGANPGLVSHFTKQSLVDIATAALEEGGLVTHEDEVRAALDAERYNEVSHLLGVKVIHVAERDSQISSVPKAPGEFVNTWSVDGFYEEGVAPAEMGWGTHEKVLPALAFTHDDGPRNQICLAQMAHTTLVRSTVPSGPIIGMVIRHGESFTICDHLTVWEGDRALYRPTVHYAYCPADAAWASLIELTGVQYTYPENQRIMNDDIIAGRDDLGVLLMGHPFGAWWTGMLTSIEEARAVAPHQNATTVQVAASILGAVQWLLTHPTGGVRVPDELPWREVLDVAAPYLGTLWSGPLAWDPVSSRADWFDQWSGRTLDREDPWQFGNFLV